MVRRRALGIAMHLDPHGLAQSELTARTGLSQQAVQQLLDGLEADGIVERVASEASRRAERVVYTAKGLKSIREADSVKREIEYRARLGERGLAALQGALAKLLE